MAMDAGSVNAAGAGSGLAKELSTAIGAPTGPNPALPVAGLPLGIKGTIA